ncbi:MAG: sugar ABC transporter permease [Mageeibacillus sp.]|jgi:arabinogalactan oligomer/maltooligosaccharide transport system permease protein|nr:sugar ABC transporter permease [Mageeibacillus sp.]MCI1264736.1 sugar ABC transporter permease [Saccharofermentans sp.]MCI1768946.1 sugar ABC transporter permease [Mageeibacillus sp.]MCI2043849.1 sugar ABC transporter permease [Mageeibacillus sp.]
MSETKTNIGESIGKYFSDLGTAVADGDGFVKGSLGIMGLGYFAHKQVIKGILMTCAEALFILMMIYYGVPYLSQFGTLGTVQFESVFDPLTMTNKTNDYDNSFLILLNSIITIFLIICFILLYVSNIKSCYRLQLDDENGNHIRTFSEELKDVYNGKFHITLLTLPTVGVILMNIIPIMVLIAVAFTNWDQAHMPPAALFDWVGIANFKAVFTNSVSSSFGYSFGKILSWTLIWAVVATFTCFIGGILLASLINSNGVYFKKMWRTFFVITIAVPQFVTLILVRNFFANQGIVNTIFDHAGIIEWLKNRHMITTNYVPFLTDKNWAKFMIIMINIWVGIPYQMLISTGILLNIPQGQVESARIDGASRFQIFRHIIMPYIMVVEGPALITDFVRNINNFNVIYLLTQDVYVTQNQLMANANAKEVDLLITWLFRLTNEYYNYKMASVIGIIVFVICAAFTLIAFSRVMASGKEEDLR